ncbi:hypothetical protein AVEN_244831-1 [Araneus ventricosus]|uniref:Endonuclease/exonuclease/phosphatase domain-containing protein n=1 Tax=Araneus ventricosus TaxID=182803 RepID=A0A4Y2SHP1_ARAVE|nr:hypothetical protein AVEN_244831-1 [Araneus ventricosus]
MTKRGHSDSDEKAARPNKTSRKLNLFIKDIGDAEKAKIAIAHGAKQIKVVIHTETGGCPVTTPKKLHTAFDSLLQKADNYFITKSKKLIIVTNHSSTVDKLLKLSKINDVPIRCRVIENTLSTQYIEGNVDTEASVIEIAEELEKEQIPVLKIVRFTKRDSHEPTPVVLLKKLGVACRDKIKLFRCVLRTHKYIENPKVCIQLYLPPSEVEVQAVRIVIDSKSILIINIYSSHGNFEPSFLEKLCESLSPPFIIVEDFNIHHQILGSLLTSRSANVVLDWISTHMCILNTSDPTYSKLDPTKSTVEIAKYFTSNRICDYPGYRSKAIKLVWVPAHVGITINEQADEAARVARTSDVIIYILVFRQRKSEKLFSECKQIRVAFNGKALNTFDLLRIFPKQRKLNYYFVERKFFLHGFEHGLYPQRKPKFFFSVSLPTKAILFKVGLE